MGTTGAGLYSGHVMHLSGTLRERSHVERRAGFRLPLPRSCSNLPRSRIDLALKTGAATLLAFWLTLALFVAPYWASQTNFLGHQHPAGTPAHVHSVHAVVGYALTVAVVAVLLALRPAWALVLEPVLWLARPVPRRMHRSRAPPLG